MDEIDDSHLEKVLTEIRDKNMKSTTIFKPENKQISSTELFVNQFIETIEFVLGNF